MVTNASQFGDSDPCWEDLTPAERLARGGELPDEPRNRRVKCKGRTVIRYQHDEGDHRKGDPILDEEYARQYRPCAAWAANGTEHCTAHGGATPAAIAAAKRTIALATPNAADVLQRLLNDERVPPETRLKAATQLLDRGGIRTGIDVSVDTPGWQQLMADMFGKPSSEDEPPAGEPPLAPKPPTEEAKPVASPRKAAKAKAKSKPPVAKPTFEGW